MQGGATKICVHESTLGKLNNSILLAHCLFIRVLYFWCTSCVQYDDTWSSTTTRVYQYVSLLVLSIPFSIVKATGRNFFQPSQHHKIHTCRYEQIENTTNVLWMLWFHKIVPICLRLLQTRSILPKRKFKLSAHQTR